MFPSASTDKQNFHLYSPGLKITLFYSGLISMCTNDEIRKGNEFSVLKTFQHYFKSLSVFIGNTFNQEYTGGLPSFLFF
jgi:hypothetical protein